MSGPAKANIPVFRVRMHELVDIICDYFENIDSRTPKASVSPGDLRALLGSVPPAQPIPWTETKDKLSSVIFQGANHWQHPRNHGYYPCVTSFPAIMGEMISKTLNNPGFAWHVSPINTELEILMNDWIAGAMNLPDFYKHENRTGGGLTHSTASESVLVALLGARNKTPGPNQVVYASEIAHFSTQKATKILKIEFRAVPVIPCSRTGNYIMDATRLNEMIQEDKAAGKTPTMVVATFGSTATCSLDPIRAIGEIAQKENMWMHIDAAYAGSALICPEFRSLIDGLELSDSFNFNGHKWLLTGFNNSVLYIKNSRFVTQSLAASASYIVPSKPEETDFMTWQIPQGRDFRSIRWWMLLNQYGMEGLQAHIRRQVALAKQFEDLLIQDSDFEVPFRAEFGLVVFAVRGSDALTRKLADQMQKRQDTIFTSAEVQGKKFVRFVVCSEYTEDKHITMAYSAIKEELSIARLSS